MKVEKPLGSRAGAGVRAGRAGAAQRVGQFSGIDFGRGAYIALYHYDGKEIVILAVRHGREAGY